MQKLGSVKLLMLSDTNTHPKLKNIFLLCTKESLEPNHMKLFFVLIVGKKELNQT